MIDAIGSEITPVTEEKYLRGSSDVSVAYGCYQKIKDYCGWQPEITLEESVAEMVSE